MHRLLASVVILLAAALAGCATSTSAPAAAARPPLTKGLSLDDVRSRWGEPAEIKTMQEQPVRAVVWTYRLKKVGDTPVATSVQEVPAIDPISGVETSIRDVNYTLSSAEVRETIELLFVDGRLVEWKRRQVADKRFQ